MPPTGIMIMKGRKLVLILNLHEKLNPALALGQSRTKVRLPTPGPRPGVCRHRVSLITDFIKMEKRLVKSSTSTELVSRKRLRLRLKCLN